MKPTTLLSVTTLLLTSTASASLVDKVQEIINPARPHLTPLTVAVQIPCCTKPPCPGCPEIRSNFTLGFTSISYPQTGLKALEDKPPGCGDGFDAEDCLRFFQVTLLTLERPLGIAVGKIGAEKEKGVKGCGDESSPLNCLRYLTGFLGELRAPLEKTLGKGAVSDVPVEDEGGCHDGYDEGKSEL
jgi:hypothetical protein